jgi:rare lipoprotein A
VTNEKNGKTVRVRVNDRGPFVAGRIVDLSKGAAAAIDSVIDGVVPVTLTVVKVGDGKRARRVPDEVLATASPTGEWAVQAGAFGNEVNAERLKEKLTARYPGPWLEDFEGLKRVKFGPYPSREEADAARDSLTELGLAGIVVPVR